MSIVSKVRPYQPKVVFQWKRLTAPTNSSTTFTVGNWSESWLKDSSNVDPLEKKLHGYYHTEASYLKTFPVINAGLTYSARSISPEIKYSITVTGDGWGYSIPRSRWLLSDEKNQSLLINNAIKGAQSEQANLALFFAELDKSVSLFSKTANKIAGAASDIRKGKFSRAARRLGIKKPRGASRNKSFANNWLEFSYGWGPLVADSVGLMKHIATNARGVLIESRSRIETSVPLSSTSQVQLGQEGASQHRILANWSYSGNWKRMEQVVLVFRLNDWFWDQVSRLGFTNPGAIAWETIPLSFVVDWFANIGDWLGALDLGLTLEYVTGSYTEFHRNSGSLTGTVLWTDLKFTQYVYRTQYGSISPSLFEDYKVRRIPLAEADVVVSFLFSSPLSVNHAITSAALVVQRLK